MPYGFILIIAIQIQLFCKHEQHSEHVLAYRKTVCTARICEQNILRNLSCKGIRACHAELKKFEVPAVLKVA